MGKFKHSEKIAFQTVDPEGDIWSNKAFIFDSSEDAEDFFSNPMNVINVLGYELEQDENEETLDYTELRINGFLYGVTFACEYAGDVKILEMSKGFVITRLPKEV